MDFRDQNNESQNIGVNEASIAQSQQAFLTKVYGWMFSGLALTGGTAAFAYFTDLDVMIAGSMLFFVFILAELGLVVFLSARIEKMSAQTAGLSFLIYSVLSGLTFSAILLNYTGEAIFDTFLICASMFAGLSIFGMTTKRNLNAMGAFMMQGLIGLILVMIFNLFFDWSILRTAINIIGIIIFSGLTAYDTKKIKEMHYVMSQGNEIASKAAITGALALYLDFINLFLFLLRLFGRDD